MIPHDELVMKIKDVVDKYTLGWQVVPNNLRKDAWTWLQ